MLKTQWNHISIWSKVLRRLLLFELILTQSWQKKNNKICISQILRGENIGGRLRSRKINWT